ncbi:MAG: hypothetical protein AAF224_00240 [Pseudomonadota bacterium]
MRIDVPNDASSDCIRVGGVDEQETLYAMMHMLSCFSLGKDVGVAAFSVALQAFSRHMQSQDLVVSVSPLGERVADTPMDTDTDRSHQYFFTMTFLDRSQCDRAYAYILKSRNAPENPHHAVMSHVGEDAVFICWRDL